jgi:hypothetical protein
VFNGATLITATDLFIHSDTAAVFRAGAFAYADMIRMNGKRTDGTQSQNDRPKLWLSGMDIRNTNGAGLEITTPNGNGIYVYSETEAVWFESVDSAALELQGGPYAFYLAANDNPNTGGAPIVYQTVDTSRPFVSIASGTASLGFESSIASSLSGLDNFSIYAPAAGSTLDIYRGDAYEHDDGTAITITEAASETHWPTTLSTVHFSCLPTDELLARVSGATGLTNIACSVTSATGSAQAFRLELTASNTSGLTVGDGTSEDGSYGYNFWFVANKDTNPKTLRAGRMNVRKDRTA